MKEILYRLTEMGQDIKGIKTDVAELKTDVAELKTRMGNLESSAEQIKTRQEVIFEQTAGLLEFRTETKAILLDIQDSQLATSDILGEHEISIRNLRRRLV
jgi:hypothetical protein